LLVFVTELQHTDVLAVRAGHCHDRDSTAHR